MRRKLLILVALFGFLFPSLVFADGMILPPKDYYVYESDQRAVILYEKDSQIETIVLSIKFQGNADNFAWIIPVPNEPEVTKGSDEIFSSLSELTQASYYDYRYLEQPLGLGAADNYKEAVQVIQTQKIDYYDITTLTSTDSQALVKWLNENGYDYPKASEYIFNSYISNNWYFVAVKIDTSALENTSISSGLKEGHATPLKLSFKAKNLVYPLKISSVVAEEDDNAKVISNTNTNNPYEIAIPNSYIDPYYYKPSTVNIQLYILADHKKTLPKFSTAYGNWVKKNDIKKWAVDDQGDPLLNPKEDKYFLTKLTRSMTYSQMDEDLFPRDAEDNKKVGVKTFDFWKVIQAIGLFVLALSIYTVLVFTIGIFSPFGITFIIATIIQFKTKKRVLRILAWITQVFVTVVYSFVGLLLLIYGFIGFSSNALIELPNELLRSADVISRSAADNLSILWLFTIILPVAVLLSIPIFIMIWQIRRKKKKEESSSQEEIVKEFINKK